MSKLTKPRMVSDALTDTVDEQSKPLVAVLNGCHAVTFIGEEGDDYVFKNSYGKNDAKNPAWIKIPKRRTPFNRTGLNFKFIFPLKINHLSEIELLRSAQTKTEITVCYH